MITAKLSTKGQVVIPSAIRKRHHWDLGQSLVIEDTEDGVILREQKSGNDLSRLVGIGGYSGKRRSLAEMEEAVRKGALERHGRH